MQQRLSLVENIKIRVVIFSSIVQIGDNSIIDLKTRTIALQRQVPIFQSNEGNFALYPIFTRPFPQPAVTENVHMSVNNNASSIEVRTINILLLSTTAVLQVGSNQRMNLESRIKHIRQLLQPGKMPNTEVIPSNRSSPPPT